MRRVERTPQAEVDLLQIWVYLAERSLPAANKLLERLESTLEMLATHPAMGESIDRIAQGLRRFSVGNYVLVYRPLENGIRLLRVFHGARDSGAIIEGIAD